jgi:tRNA dimethylallyltransferase
MPNWPAWTRPPQRAWPPDAQRIQRALEVWQAQRAARCRPGTKLGAARMHRMRALAAGGAGADLARLAARAHRQRLDHMLAAACWTKCKRLRARGDLQPTLPAMRCVGYRQAWQALDQGRPPADGCLRDSGMAATRQLAKRQLTWLRSVPDRHVVIAPMPPDATARRLLALKHLCGAA